MFLAVFLQFQNLQTLFNGILHVIELLVDWLAYFAFRAKQERGELKAARMISNVRALISLTPGYGQDKKFWCDGVEHISLCSCRDGGTGTSWSKLYDEGIFKVYSVESLVAEFGGTLGPHT